ncbi:MULTISPECIES: DUF3558 family protein [unclassified Streptomyces]|uniref:DUF3558 family protein n=1 Tax=unclassified Streptomyces TaxID=2593676 RepID=UPI002DD97C12|nr:DUF3558 family protein [Streptomyces sp. NBC_01750]WSB01069.1 DUF3558 domain-containing protein [Streptomyces sp. NBC_01794]WSD34578.1 DUF3558 domain-containing protein [Streptomyces sp. NBC_01750]
MHRSATRLTRILACAAVPVMLVVAGCSSDSAGDSKKDSSSSASSPDAQKPATVAPAKYSKLPEPCKTISAKTIEQLVPKTKVKSGTAGKSTDIANRGSCSWNGLDDNGVKGSQYRWLDVSFLRYESESSLGISGEKRAEDSYAKEISKAKSVEGAKKVRSSPAAGLGEAATAVGYDLEKTGEDFTYATVVARTGNVVITLTYNGTGYAGAKSPSASDLMKDAVTASKEAVASVTAANK